MTMPCLSVRAAICNLTRLTVILYGLIDNPHSLKVSIFGAHQRCGPACVCPASELPCPRGEHGLTPVALHSVMEREVELVLKETGLADAAALLRANGVYNLESMRVMAGVSRGGRHLRGTL